MKRLFAALFALLLTLSFTALASNVPQPNDDFYYYDSANVLSAATKGEIFFSNERLRKACGAEIVIVAIPSTDGEEMSTYTYNLWHEWGIGGTNDLGFLLLMSIDDDDYYYMLGTNYENYVTVDTIADLADEYLEPFFAAKDYDTGAKNFFEAVFKETADALNVEVTTQEGIDDYEAYSASANSTTETTETTEADFGGVGDRSEEPAVSYTSHTGDLGATVMGVFIVILIIGFAVLTSAFSRRSFRGYRHNPPPPPPMGGPRPPMGSGFGGEPRPPMGGGPRPSGGGFGGGPRPSGGGFGGGSRPSGGGFGGGSRPSGGGFGGSSRSSGGFGGFGGSSRSSGSSHSSGGFGGFGGSSRSGGGSTRGAGGGRGRR